ncbi:hypothetical protein [Streptococcus suis]
MTTTLEKLYEIYPTTASIIPYKEWQNEDKVVRIIFLTAFSYVK